MNNKNIYLRLIITVSVFMVFLFTNEYSHVLYGDADGYWNLSVKFFKSFSHGEQFSLYNFNSPLRGYLYPLSLLPAYVFCYLTKIPIVWIAKLLGVFWATLLFAWVLPRFWNSLTGRAHSYSIVSFMAMVIFIVWSWGDYFSFTLTDFPAFTLFLLSLLWLRSGKSGVAWLLSGISLAAALNFRPIYLAAIPGVGLLFMYSLIKIEKNRILYAIYFLAGTSLVLVPQFLINIHSFNAHSPFVLGYYNNSPLYQWHLAWGLKVQKFESAIVEPVTNIKLVVTHDVIGNRLLQSITGGKAFASIHQYVLALLSHPIDFICLFARHLFCNLDIRYNAPYLLRVNDKGTAFFITNFSILFLGMVMLKRIRFKLVVIFQLIALAAVVIAALPLVVEPRFVMPLHLLLVAAAILGTTPQVWWRFLKKSSSARNQLMVSYCIWMAGCLMLAGYANNQISFEPIGFFR
ncbi:MAG: hypothetical protein EOP45_08445 [Sphingobacteriaceae bacterium]|nr:MAG: hypothetical protein EOP45_08445 [Sphingobacteriaceae bacterium]